ncbi:MAG: hypothetical protein DMF81_13190 [Acidobacteria bacterium]|nr:MAG: hypothetical protein DMF81_13190 [Acidobacteriota bacterium]
MRARSTWAALALFLLPAAAAVAQEQASGPPPVLVISQEEIKPGSMAAHEKQVVSYLALFNRANVEGHRLGLVPVSGDDNQVLYTEAYASFADFEATRKKGEEAFAASPALQAEMEALDRQTGPMHATQRTLIAAYRPDLSYRPLGADGVGKSRYFTVTTVRIKAGRANDYEEYTKQYNRARDKANLDEHTAVYQVITGASSGTFIITRKMQARNKAIDDALGGDLVVKQRRETAEAIFAESRSSLYAFNPRISRPPAQIAAADPDFWNPKPVTKALAAKKEVKKDTKATRETKDTKQ